MEMTLVSTIKLVNASRKTVKSFETYANFSKWKV